MNSREKVRISMWFYIFVITFSMTFNNVIKSIEQRKQQLKKTTTVGGGGKLIIIFFNSMKMKLIIFYFKTIIIHKKSIKVFIQQFLNIRANM